MKWIKQCYHFLGGVIFAIVLITCAAVFVIAGTLIESYTDSHLYAARWTYQHPLFAFLLILFFINILFAALRRWPFRQRHVPFLITHLGLLMIISGTLIKNWYGTQGQMMLLEGSGSQHVSLPHTFALHINQKQPDGIFNATDSLTGKHQHFPELRWKVVGYAPHSSEKFETWIKGKQAYFPSLPPFQAAAWHSGEAIPYQVQARFQPAGELWNIAAIQTDQVEEAIEAAYTQDMTVQISTVQFPEKKIQIPLNELLIGPISIAGGQLSTSLDYAQAALNMNWISSTGLEEHIAIPLQGPQALIPYLIQPGRKGRTHFNIDLQRPPAILIVQDEWRDCQVCAFDSNGRLAIQSFRGTDLQSLICYDKGFGGYAIQYLFPFSQPSLNRQQQEQNLLTSFQKQLQGLLVSNPSLSPPLKLLAAACQKTEQDWTAVLIPFLHEWGAFHPFLFPKNKSLKSEWETVFNAFDWNQAPTVDRQACVWTSLLFDHLQYPIQQGEDPIAFLHRHKWPLLSQLNTDENTDLLSQLAQQMFALASSLPALDFPSKLTANETAFLFSAYLKGYGIDDSLLNFDHASIEKPNPLTLEVPLTARHNNEVPLRKLEDNRPRVLVEFKKNNQKQLISLIYDPLGTGLKWPILKGEYTVRFQPLLKEIPYRVRLRSARQINYSHSSQPFSYECDVCISDRQGTITEKTLSMNQVHETWDGYRFYLAGMSPTQESGIKRVQLVINHDPAKYILTYPGALLVALGIILLFWMRPYRRT